VRDKAVFVIAAAAVLIGGTAACSSGEPSARQPGTLATGTAKLSIDGKDLPTTRVVNCAPPDQYMSVITTGDDQSGATVMLSNAGKLTVELVRIRNLDGFSGDYNRGLAGNDATVALTDNTYSIAGAANGYGPQSPVPANTPFTIKVAC
jgi:ipoprotein LpqH